MTATRPDAEHQAAPTGGLVVQDLGVTLTGAARRRRRRHRPRPAARRGRRPGRRVRLRQDHGRHLAARLLPGRRGHLGGQGAHRGPRRAQAALEGGPAAARRGDRLRPAGPGLRAQPGHPDRQADRRAAGAARHRHRRVAAAGRARRPGRGRPAERRRVPQALRPPALRAARCSASRWRWRSCPSPRCWSSTSRPPASTSPPRRWCSTPWPSCAARTASARSTSPTTSRWSPTSPTAWR